MMRSWLIAALALAACTPAASPDASTDIALISRELDARAQGDADGRGDHLRELLEDNVHKDAYDCLPPVETVFARPPAPAPARRIVGALPHYDFYRGPLLYRMGPAKARRRGNRRRAPRAEAGQRSRRGGRLVWNVALNIALVPTSDSGTFEMSDCALRSELDGEVHCEGTPFEQAEGLEACPDSGRFEAPVSRHNLRKLLQHWSREVEGHYNRDARRYQLPVRYDFEFFLADDAAGAPVDLRLPLALSCGRTPYFMSMRTGWSVSIVAHELGHYLGLLDEYESLSGMSDAYPKTPFVGSEDNRMGVSMKQHTRFLPHHHYMVMRRYHCDEPIARDPYKGVL
jgi:hypothetical protein